MRFWCLLTLSIMSLVLCGCVTLSDMPKTIWGSSTRVLEKGRRNAIIKTYDKDYWDCIRNTLDVIKNKGYVLFQKDEVRGMLVVMGIPGAVQTTEVGIFLVEVNDHQTRLEISSLSTNAKRIVAKGLFHGLDIAYGLAVADKEEGFSVEEFQNNMTVGGLVKTIVEDGFSVPSANTDLESLNLFLNNEKFYDFWAKKYRRSITLSQEALDLVDISFRNSSQVKRLNRLLLELTYPFYCPKMKEDKIK